jgi:hypothetical protein
MLLILGMPELAVVRKIVIRPASVTYHTAPERGWNFGELQAQIDQQIPAFTKLG